MKLHTRWIQLMSDCGVNVLNGAQIFEQLCECYTQPHRHYHNLNHIEQMLGWLEIAGINEPAARYATWFHDAVYRPGNGDNERRSAELACHTMIELSLPMDMITQVEQIILATKTHKGNPDDEVLCAVLDADMAILGSEPHNYQQYAENVRKEFVHIPDFLYRRGRRAFLQSLLNSESIFQTPWARLKLESQARQNVEKELAPILGI